MSVIQMTGERKRTKLDTILTAISPTYPAKLQIDAIRGWLPATAAIVVTGRVKHQELAAGLELHEQKGDFPTLREMFQFYTGKNPNFEVLAICKPNLVLNENPGLLLDFLTSAGAGRAWAFYVPSLNSGSPHDFFVTTTAVVTHLIKSIPSDMTLEGDDWAVWLHAWFEENMPLHRYMDATKFDLVLGRLNPPPEPPSLHSVTSLAAQALEEIAPVRSWAKREETEHLPRMTAKAISEAISEFPAESDMEVGVEKTEALSGQGIAPIVKKARGRPKGSKNKK
jgi:hypothetical protein